MTGYNNHPRQGAHGEDHSPSQQHRRSYQAYSNRFQAGTNRQQNHPSGGHGPREFLNGANYGDNSYWSMRKGSVQVQGQNEAKGANNGDVNSNGRNGRNTSPHAKVHSQSPIGPTPRVQERNGDINRMPYSAALLGIGTSPTRNTTVVSLPKIEEKGSSPISQAMGTPPTPALTSSQERSIESDTSVAELKVKMEESKTGEMNKAKLSPKVKGATTYQHQERRAVLPREYDPYGVFVSRFPIVDNIESCLADFFSSDCRVRNVRIQASKGLSNVKFAFVDFEDVESTQRALNRSGEMFFGSHLNIKPKGMPGYFTRGGGGDGSGVDVHGRPQNTTYKILTHQEGHHEEGDGTSKAAVGEMPPINGPTGNNTTRPDEPNLKPRALSSSPNNKYKNSALPKNPLKGNNVKKNDGTANHPAIQNIAPYHGEQCYPMPWQEGHYHPYAPMYWQYPPLSPDQMVAQPTTATNSPDQAVSSNVNDGSNGTLSPKTPLGPSDNAARVYQMGQPQYPMPIMPYPIYDPTSANNSRNMTFPSCPPSMTENGDMTHWPMLTVDPTGQQYIVHPYGSGCYPSMNQTYHPSQAPSIDQSSDVSAAQKVPANGEKESNHHNSVYNGHQGFYHPLQQFFATCPGPMSNAFGGIPPMNMPYGAIPFPHPMYTMPMQYRPGLDIGKGPLLYGHQQVQMMPGGQSDANYHEWRGGNTNGEGGQAPYAIESKETECQQDGFGGGVDADNKPISVPAWMNDCY